MTSFILATKVSVIIMLQLAIIAINVHGYVVAMWTSKLIILRNVNQRGNPYVCQFKYDRTWTFFKPNYVLSLWIVIKRLPINIEAIIR